MLELILYNLGLSWKLLVVYLITLFVLGCIWFFAINKFNLRDGKIKMYGLLLGIDNTGAFMLSLHIVRAFLIIYYSIFPSENIEFTLALIAIASIIYIVFDMRNILFEIFNTVSLIVVIYFINSLNTYMLEVENSLSVNIIKIALILFTLMYTIYYLLKNFENITTDNENILLD